MRLGVRHGWFWSAVFGVVLGYSTRGSDINPRTALIGWLVLGLGLSGARLLNFAFDEPGWWVAQIERKGIGTMAWNTVWGLVWFAVFYAVIMGVAGLVAYGVAGFL